MKNVADSGSLTVIKLLSMPVGIGLSWAEINIKLLNGNMFRAPDDVSIWLPY
jgi:hypothetical protein